MSNTENCFSKDSAFRAIRTYYGKEVEESARLIFSEDPDRFLDEHGNISHSRLLLLQEIAWKTCSAMESVIILSMVAMFSPEGSIPKQVFLDWLEKRYGSFVKNQAVRILKKSKSRFVSPEDSDFVINFFELRDEAIIATLI